MDPNPYYIIKDAGFTKHFENARLSLDIYQPKPEGVVHLCRHYSEKYRINLQCINLTNYSINPANLAESFLHLKNNPDLFEVAENTARGLVLSNGQYHAVPIYVCNENGHKSIIVFDSSVGGREGGYFKIAKYFPEYDFYINRGTRQADEGSCITDSICILKEALLIANLVELVSSSLKESIYCINYKPFMFKESQPDNLHVFKIPEQLLLTAQVSDFVRQCDANIDTKIRGGKTLGQYRSQFSMTVSLSFFSSIEASQADNNNINSYLFVKSAEHKNILDNVYRLECLEEAKELHLFFPQPEDERKIKSLELPSPDSEARKAYRMLHNVSV